MAKPLSSTIQKKLFYKQTFEIRGKNIATKRHTLLVNPEDMQVSEPARVAVTQTLAGSFVHDFGIGLPQVTLSGQTGYGARYNADGVQHDGYTEIKALKDGIYRHFLDRYTYEANMYWYNWEDEEYYRIMPTSFRLMRNKNEPTLYRYEIQFTCLSKLNAALGERQKYDRNRLHDISIARTAQQLDLAKRGLSDALYASLRGK